MRKIIWGAVAIMAVTTPVLAHDFWIQPTRFTLAEPGAVPVLLYVGHGAARERWGVSADRVVLFRTVGPDGMVDRMSTLTLDGPRVDAVVPLSRPGAYLLAFQSKPAASELPYLRFNQYLAEEGLTPIQANRKRTNTERSNGKEQYSRRAKSIVQVGPVDAASIARVTRPVGLSLEIVPERHPGTLKTGEALPVRVYYNRKPLAGALVKLTNLNDDDKPLKTQRTNAAGRTSFIVPRTGSWQFNVVWADVTTGNPAADYNTVFSSLSFGN